MDLIQRFKVFSKEQNLFSPKDKLLLAVSGGVDSVVLCELCREAGSDFIIAHCNFQLRGQESERDEHFVKKLGKKYGVETFAKKFDTEKYAEENKLSIQEAARELRYDWFQEIAQDKHAHYILTAHHADDNAETVLMNFCRGTGLQGLTGIPVAAGNIRRPLLEFSKKELVQFAIGHKLEFVEDSSNQSSKYTRNLFRNEIIPAISKTYPQVKENLKDNIDRFKEIAKLYEVAVSKLKKKLCWQKGNEIHVPVMQLMGFQNRALIYEIISDFGFTEKQVDEVIKLAESGSGHYLESPSGKSRIIKHRRWFIIAPGATKDIDHFVIEKGMSELEWGRGSLRFEMLSNSKLVIPDSSKIAFLDSGNIQYPLMLRKWKTGDYFYPLGMKKKKKLSRFFIDQKTSKTEKENAWVIESDRRIIWVVNYRIDERFKVTGNTTQVLKLTLS